MLLLQLRLERFLAGLGAMMNYPDELALLSGGISRGRAIHRLKLGCLRSGRLADVPCRAQCVEEEGRCVHGRAAGFDVRAGVLDLSINRF